MHQQSCAGSRLGHERRRYSYVRRSVAPPRVRLYKSLLECLGLERLTRTFSRTQAELCAWGIKSTHTGTRAQSWSLTHRFTVNTLHLFTCEAVISRQTWSDLHTRTWQVKEDNKAKLWKLFLPPLLSKLAWVLVVLKLEFESSLEVKSLEIRV